MANATNAIPSFLGGEVSQFAAGRFDKPDYRVSMRTCLNSFPVEIGAWTRRPGTRHGGLTRASQPGRVMRFDFQQANAATLEFTDGVLRFRSGAILIPTNDPNPLVSISAANPAVFQTASPHGWTSGQGVYFFYLPPAPLQNRQFFITVVDPTHFSLLDGLTGAPVDGATISPLVGTVFAARIQELATPYIGGSWATIRAVQAETTDILLAPTVAPQALTVTVPPAPTINAQFALSPAVFNDGPYLDPFTNGVQATPSAKSGIITLTLAFPAYAAAKAYRHGDFVTSAGVNYVSLVDQNVGSAPPSANWSATSAQAAINEGRGFLGTDTGRLVRLFSEPLPWNVATAYLASTAAIPVIVGYNPSGENGATIYYQALVASTGKVPGTDLTNWQIAPQGAAIWSWGKITGLSNILDRALAGSGNFGDMILGGGVNAPFNGVFSQAFTAGALAMQTGSNPFGYPLFTQFSLTSYVGKNYSGATDQAIQSATVYSSSDLGFAGGHLIVLSASLPFAPTVVLNLRGKASAPASSSDGTLLGTSGSISGSVSTATILSNNIVTAWKYVWIEIISTTEQITTNRGTDYTLDNAIGQISFFGPPGTGTGAGVSVEILGPPLLYTNPVVTWRLGVYSDTTGWPTCGIYSDGRLYLGGAVGNRFDASVSNGIDRGTVNFAPTNQYGVVGTNSAISYVFNSNGVNPILWMDADLQGIKMGTQAGEWLVVAPTAGPIAPNNISARNVTGHGSANIQPCRTEHTTIFVQRFARKLLEYFPDVYSGKFSAPNLADKAEHLTNAGVAELAYTSATTPIIWMRDQNSALFGITYKRDTLASAQPPSYYAWHRHLLGSDRIVKSICSGPSVDGNLDALTMVTFHPVTGAYHVEIMTDVGDETMPLSLSWFLDDAVLVTSTVSIPTGLTINGLWHLNGKTVQVFAGGLDCGDPGEDNPPVDFTVANGSVFVPYGDGISAGPGRGLFTADFVLTNPQIVVGFTYNSDGQLMRMIAQADTGARNGPAFGALSRMHRYIFKLVNTLGMSVGTRFDKLLPCLFRTEGDGPIPELTTFSGIHQDSIEDDDSYDNALCWRISRPFPATIVAAGANLNTKDQ